MAVIVKERVKRFHTEYRLDFVNKETGEADWSFPLLHGERTIPVPCQKDENGVYKACAGEKCPWWGNYQRMRKDDSYEAKYEVLSLPYWEPAVLLCSCGNHIQLDSFAQVCAGCGKSYNQWGQELLSSLSCSY